jgi:hypothetical protein
VSDPRLDRRVHFDERSRAFPIRQLIPAIAKPRGYSWACDVNLDQGQDGACVGFSVSQEAAARPVVVPGITNDVAVEIYHRARVLDDFPGEDYEGSSVLGGIKAGRERGWYPEFRWAFGLDDLVLAIGYKGPAVLGINWYTGMFDPDTSGFLHVTGVIEGGHAILANRVNVQKRYVTLHNSWGLTWGLNGEAKITYEDLDRLLHEQGEACIPVRRALSA